jgi:uncharacterized protein YuzE
MTPDISYGSNAITAPKWSERYSTVHGYLITYDAIADASYARTHLRPVGSLRQIEVDENRIILDVDSEGTIIGVECLSGRLNLDDMLMVIARCKVTE